MKKCPPGLICVGNGTILFLILCVVVLGFFLHLYSKQSIVLTNSPSFVNKENHSSSNGLGLGPGLGLGLGFGLGFGFPNYPYSNLPGDVLLNPYAPPLSNDRYLVPNINLTPPGTIPINISTNVGAVNTNYRQVGMLTSTTNSKGKIIPLIGRPLFTNRDKWQYYTMSDQNNSIKLPISKNGRSCTNEYGCDRLYNGDIVYVEGLNQPHKITIYDSDTIRYLPF